MNDIKIVQYGPKYAASLADMWNKSGDNWGGNDNVYTEEEILDTEDLQGNLKTFLAIDGDQVVGYCSFSEYKEDEGASYIPLLNVMPEYLGKKIGKQLVLACVDEAIKAPWPRLDLYTWPGNTKAVPLYKKCGFFWEKRDDSTHLMNFLPYVMATKAVQAYFKTMDWYKDSKRDIEIEPDGRQDGKFDYFDYVWQKDDTYLRMEFERRGRGLSAIETNDYLIEVRTDKQKLVMGMDYEVIYHIVNKSGEKLTLSIEGESHKNISHDFKHQSDFEGDTTLKSSFKIETIQEAQDKWKSHPCITSIIYINGEPAKFMLGIDPKLPLEIAHGNHKDYLHLGDNTLYIDIENGFDQPISVTGQLPSNDLILPVKNDFHFKVVALGKASIPIAYTLKAYGHYSETLSFTIQINDKQLTYERTLNALLRGQSARFSAEDKEFYYLINGPYTINYRKKNNSLSLYHIINYVDNFLWIATPQLGLPYSVEFSNSKPTDISFIETRDSNILKATFMSKKLAGIEITFFYELMNSGMLNMFAQVRNTTNKAKANLGVNFKVFQLLDNVNMPYDGKVVRSRLRDGYFTGSWDKKHVDETWLISGYDLTKALIWDASHKMKFSEQFIELESEIASLEASARHQTKAITLGVNTFKDWQDVRKFAGYQDKRVEIDDLDIALNDHNPFLAEQTLDIAISERKSKKISGQLNVSSSHDHWVIKDLDLDFLDHTAKTTLNSKNPFEMDIVHINIETDVTSYTSSKALFMKQDGGVSTLATREDDQDVYSVDNGLISLKASPSFGAGIYSMTYQGHEWLDNSFPTPTEKGWWNYWIGGIHTIPEQFNYMSIFEEKKTAEFVELKDSKDNIWTGIKTTLIIEKQEDHKGTKIEDYYLLISGVPVMCHFSVVHQNTNKFLIKPYVTLEYIQAGNDIDDNWVKVSNDEKISKYKCNPDGFETTFTHSITYGSKTTDTMMIKLGDPYKAHEVDNTNGVLVSEDVYAINEPHGSTTLFDTAFYVFSKDQLTTDMLKDLYGISFKF